MSEQPVSKNNLSYQVALNYKESTFVPLAISKNLTNTLKIKITSNNSDAYLIFSEVELTDYNGNSIQLITADDPTENGSSVILDNFPIYAINGIKNIHGDSYHSSRNSHSNTNQINYTSGDDQEWLKLSFNNTSNITYPLNLQLFFYYAPTNSTYTSSVLIEILNNNDIVLYSQNYDYSNGIDFSEQPSTAWKTSGIIVLDANLYSSTRLVSFNKNDWLNVFGNNYQLNVYKNSVDTYPVYINFEETDIQGDISTGNLTSVERFNSGDYLINQDYVRKLGKLGLSLDSSGSRIAFTEYSSDGNNLVSIYQKEIVSSSLPTPVYSFELRENSVDDKFYDVIDNVAYAERVIYEYGLNDSIQTNTSPVDNTGVYLNWNADDTTSLNYECIALRNIDLLSTSFTYEIYFYSRSHGGGQFRATPLLWSNGNQIFIYIHRTGTYLNVYNRTHDTVNVDTSGTNNSFFGGFSNAGSHGGWYHVVYTQSNVNGNTLSKIYVNGALNKQQTTTGESHVHLDDTLNTLTNNGSSYLPIGVTQNNPPYFMCGKVSYANFWTTALTDSQVLDLYNNRETINRYSQYSFSKVGDSIASPVSGINWGKGIDLNSNGSIISIASDNGAYVYQYNETNWIQLGNNTDTPGVSGSIAINKYGNLIALAQEKSAINYNIYQCDTSSDSWSPLGSTLTISDYTTYGINWYNSLSSLDIIPVSLKNAFDIVSSITESDLNNAISDTNTYLQSFAISIRDLAYSSYNLNAESGYNLITREVIVHDVITGVQPSVVDNPNGWEFTKSNYGNLTVVSYGGKLTYHIDILTQFLSATMIITYASEQSRPLTVTLNGIVESTQYASSAGSSFSDANLTDSLVLQNLITGSNTLDITNSLYYFPHIKSIVIRYTENVIWNAANNLIISQDLNNWNNLKSAFNEQGFSNEPYIKYHSRFSLIGNVSVPFPDHEFIFRDADDLDGLKDTQDTNISVTNYNVSVNGTGAIFNGSDSYLSLTPWEFGGEPITVEAYVKYDAFNSWSRIFDFADGDGTVDAIVLSNTSTTQQLVFNVRNGSIANLMYSASSSFYLADTWAHVVVTVDGTTMKLYKDGVLTDTKTDGQEPTNLTRVQHWIGRSGFSTDDYFDGTIAYIRFWHGISLNETQIQALYYNRLFDYTFTERNNTISNALQSANLIHTFSNINTGDWGSQSQKVKFSDDMGVIAIPNNESIDIHSFNSTTNQVSSVSTITGESVSPALDTSKWVEFGEEKANMALSADGSIIIIQSDDSTNSNYTSIFVYKNINGTWTQYGDWYMNGILINNGEYISSSDLGWSNGQLRAIDISGDGTTIVLGSGHDAGYRIRVFKYFDGKWDENHDGGAGTTGLGRGTGSSFTGSRNQGHQLAINYDGTITHHASITHTNNTNQIFMYSGAGTTWYQIGTFSWPNTEFTYSEWTPYGLDISRD